MVFFLFVFKSQSNSAKPLDIVLIVQEKGIIRLNVTYKLESTYLQE